MRLSVDAINEKSPIWVIQLDDMLFRFITRNGIKYRAGFYPDPYFLEEGAYHFFIQRIDDAHSSYDPDVLFIIQLIIEEFFRTDSNVMLYICDPTDGRQAIRSRLYRKWFQGYSKKEEFTLVDASMAFQVHTFYAGLLIKKSNPAYKQILEAFDDFIKLVPYDTSVIPK